jgi:hypothetical protein
MLRYKGQEVDFEFICNWVASHPVDEECLDLFVFLFANKDSIQNDAILGLLDYIEDNDWELTPLRNKLQESKPKIHTLPKRRLKPQVLLYPMALGLFFGLYWLGYRPYQNKTLVTSHFPIETGLPNFLSNHDTLHKTWRELMHSFKSERYNEALQLISEIEKNKPSNDTLLYYKGISAFMTPRYEMGSASFRALLAQKQSVFANDATYMLALSLLREGQDKEARKILLTIKNDTTHPHQKASKSLLENYRF